MKPDYILSRHPFEGCVAPFETAGIVLFGAGFDGTSSYRPGSRFAPTAIRAETLYSQENYSPYFQKDLTDLPLHDLGDIDIPFGDKELTLRRIRETAVTLLTAGKKPLAIGGEHLISLPLIEATLEKYPDLRIVQLDAHLDLMDELFGERISHGTVMRRAHDLLGDGRIYQTAIRSGSREEYEFASEHTRLFQFNVNGFCKTAEELAGFPVYVTIDLDAFDPALLPGTGTPEAGGIFFPEFIRFLEALLPLNIIGGDMVELSPQIDPTHNSTIVAAKALREILMVMASC